MEIILGKTAGFCYGVKTAVTNAEEKLKEYKNVSCLGELVHNGEVIKKLEKLGLSVVENIEDSKSKVIIRAHGISKDIYKKAEALNIEVFDFTCPFVLKIHNIAEEYSKIKKMSGQITRTKNILVGCIILVLFPRDGFVSIFKK